MIGVWSRERISELHTDKGVVVSLEEFDCMDKKMK